MPSSNLDRPARLVLGLLGVCCLLSFAADLLPTPWLTQFFRVTGFLGDDADALLNSPAFWYLLRCSGVPYLGAGVMLLWAARQPREHLTVVQVAMLTAGALLLTCCAVGATARAQPLWWVLGALECGLALVLLTATYPKKRPPEPPAPGDAAAGGSP